MTGAFPSWVRAGIRSCWLRLPDSWVSPTPPTMKPKYSITILFQVYSCRKVFIVKGLHVKY